MLDGQAVCMIHEFWGIQLRTIIVKVVCYQTGQETLVTLLSRCLFWVTLHIPWRHGWWAPSPILAWQQGRENVYQLSHARVVENAFSRLKGRWHSLMKRNDNMTTTSSMYLDWLQHVLYCTITVSDMEIPMRRSGLCMLVALMTTAKYPSISNSDN